MSLVEDILKSMYENEKSDYDPISIDGFNAMVRIEETQARTAEVPVEYLEDGSFTTENMILGPTILTITGEISNVFLGDNPFLKILDQIKRTVGAVQGFVPPRTLTQELGVEAINNSVDKATSLLDETVASSDYVNQLIGSQTTSKGYQQDFHDRMNAIMDSKRLIAVGMPFKQFKNMAIINFELGTDRELDGLGFTITLQECRFTSIETREVAVSPSSAAKDAVASETNKGVQEPVKLPEDQESLLYEYGGEFAKYLKSKGIL